MNTQRMIANMRRNLEINQRMALGRNIHPTEFRIEMSEETLLAIIAEDGYAVRSSTPAIFGSVIVINDSLPDGDFNILKVMR